MAVRPRRISRRQMKIRQRRLKFFAWTVSLGLVGGAFVTGYKMTMRSVAGGEAFPVNTERRESAMRAMDEAVRAKNEGRLNEALLAAEDARRADPQVAGADAITAEIAMAQRQTPIVRQFAARALQQGHNKSAAKLLLAMAEATAGGSSRGSDQVVLLLKESSQEELSNPAVHYIWGDLLRISGREKDARQKLLGNLHRQEPWMSSTLLAAKMQLASVASGEEVEARGKIAPTAVGEALIAVQNALRSGGNVQIPLENLSSSIAAYQVRELLDDPAFDVPAPPPTLEEARIALPPPIPHGGQL